MKRAAFRRQLRESINGVPEEYSPGSSIELVTRLIAVITTRSHIVQVAEDARAAADQAVTADRRAAGHRGAASHRGMRADADVVADLDLVVEAHVLLEHRVLDRAAIDGGVGADLAVVADQHAAVLRHLDPAAGVHRQAETVGAEHRAGMDQHALAEADAPDQGDARDQFAAFADLAVLADHAARADRGAGVDARAGADGDERTDMRARIDFGVGSDDRTGMDAGPQRRRRLEQCRDPRERDVRIVGDQRGAGEARSVLLAHHHDAGLRLRQLRAVARVGQEGELSRAGAGKRADRVDLDRGVAAQTQPEAFGQRGCRMGGPVHDRCGLVRARTRRRR